MPIHLDDLDVVSEIAGSSSALIVPCNMCPAVTVAVKENKPFVQLFRSFLKSAPFQQHIEGLQARLGDMGTETKVFKSLLPHQWFLCMWTSGQRAKLRKHAKQHDAVIVMGCPSATETVRDAVEETDTKVIEGMEVTSFMNAKLRFHLPCNVSFDDCKIVPMTGQEKEQDLSA
ncbi:MAG: hypothetical protein GTN75_15315 [Gemmatimonadetes bacterium]|nr:hypothetical protein [Gemmatimonadota bacterium]